MNTVMQYVRPDLIWFIIGLCLCLIEFVAPGLVFIFFGIGALIVSGICMVFSISLTAQLLIFLVTSFACLAFLRKHFSTIFSGGVKDEKKIIENYTGEKVVVKERISPSCPGKVELFGTLWNAESASSLEPGDIAEVIERKNLVLIVKSPS
jgi:inner membrane protein